MGATATAVIVLYGFVLAAWVARCFVVALVRRQWPTLRRRDPQRAGDDAPLVSVLIPAKDEEPTIGRCLESILAQTYPHLEVVVVDDRSRDRTAEVVRAIAQRDPRVRLVQTADLPAGWTGKTYALWRGAAEARGSWLCFVDADTWHVPENLGVVLHYAEQHQVDLVSLLPGLDNRTFWERVVQPLAAITLLKMHHGVHFDREEVRATEPAPSGWRQYAAHAGRVSIDGFANGQYILIRRDVYEAVGGHEQVRDEFLEDAELGRLVQARGYRVRVVMANEITRARMYAGGREIVCGWSRIFYGATHRRPFRLLMAGLGMVCFSLSAFFVLARLLAEHAVLLTGAAADGGERLLWTITAMNLAHWGMMLPTLSTLYRMTGSRRRWLVFYPLACLGVVSIVARALWMCCTHRVSWRGRDYHRAPASKGAVGLHRGSSLLMHR